MDKLNFHRNNVKSEAKSIILANTYMTGHPPDLEQTPQYIYDRPPS